MTAAVHTLASRSVSIKLDTVHPKYGTLSVRFLTCVLYHEWGNDGLTLENHRLMKLEIYFLDQTV
jgi:hypothetical protein